jgi:hypothetical protein
MSGHDHVFVKFFGVAEKAKHVVFLAKRKLLAERLHIGQGAVEKAG